MDGGGWVERDEMRRERDDARAIARRLSHPLRYHAEHGCMVCTEHIAELDALPWAKSRTSSDSGCPDSVDKGRDGV
jgi:hypothetical protein